MASSANASTILASASRIAALEAGIADCSGYVRGDSVDVTAVSDARRRGRALLASSYDLAVDFEMTVIGAAYGYDDDLDALVDAVTANLTDHVNSGALDAAVADYAVSYGVADFAVAAPPQVVATTYDVVSIPTPDWLTPSPTLPPTPSPSTTFAPTRPPSVPYRGKKAAGAEADGRFWLIFLLAAIAVAAVAFGFTYLFMHVMLERGLKARGARTKKPTAQGTVVPYMVSDGPATPKTPKVVETEAAREKRDALAESRGAALGRLGSVRELRVAPGGAPRRASDLPDVPVPTSILPTRAQYEATQHAIDDLSEDQLASLILKKPPAKPKHGDFGLTDANQPVHHLAVSKTDSAWARKAHLPPIESAAAQDEPLSPKLEILGSSRAEKVSPRLRLAPIDDRGTEESKGHRGDDADDPAPPTYQPALGRNFSAKRGDLESGRAPKK